MSATGEHEWLHALRNATNATIASLAVVRRALEQGDVQVALTFVAHAEAAGERCRLLLLEERQVAPGDGRESPGESAA